MTTPDRLPPHNLDAERAVLGSMLRENAVIGEMSLLLAAESFYLDAHRKVYRAILDLHDPGGRPVDLVLLHAELVRRQQIEVVGDAANLAVLWDASPTTANARYYALLVRDQALLRSLIGTATEILRDGYEANQPAEQLLEQAEQRILAVSELGRDGQTVTLNAILAQVLARIDARRARGDGLSGLATGFVDLDTLTAGWQKSELIVLAARPSVGKTALALALMERVLCRGGSVFFASLEQSRWELGERLLTAAARINGQHVRRGLLHPEQLDALHSAGQSLYGLPLHIDDTSHQSMRRIAANARRLHQKTPLALVCVDYLQLVAPENPRENRADQVGGVARRLKELARELDVPVLALAQLNREVEGRTGEAAKPRLADLRSSGEIEQHADVVILLHKGHDRPDTLDLLVRKQRNGPTGEVTLVFRRDTFTFEDFQPTPFE